MKNQIQRLNRLLCGTIVASETYDRYIKDMRDEKIINDFKEFKRCYEEYSDELCEKIRALGGTPREDSGIPGKMAKHTYKIKKHDRSALLRSAAKGEKTAVSISEKILKQGLSPDCAALVAEHIAKSRTHLDEIRREIDAKDA